MTFWIREATLQIAGNKYSLDALRFTFEIPFEDSEELTTATITATNLSPNTRNSIQKGHAVIVNAGYEGDIGCILVGKVAGLSHKYEAPDNYTLRETSLRSRQVGLTEWLSQTAI